MKALLFAITMAMVVNGLGQAHTVSAQGTTTATIGHVEQVEGGFVKGWVYKNDQPVELAFSFRKTDNSETRTYYITNQQESNKIAYFTQRQDVKNYLYSRGFRSFSYPQGFMLTGKFLPNGSWILAGVFNSNTSELLDISSSNKILTITDSVTYAEGYVDSTSEGIKGWAYSSKYSSPNFGPKIDIVMSKVGTNEIKSFSLYSTSEQFGYMARTDRSDVTTFLTVRRGQSFANIYPEANRAKLGFTFNYNSDISDPTRPLTAGKWRIDSITADSEPIVFGNTNPSQIVTVN